MNELDYRNFLLCPKSQKVTPVEGHLSLHEVLLPLNQLDKFKNKKDYKDMDFRVQATFVSDPYLDKLFFS